MSSTILTRPQIPLDIILLVIEITLPPLSIGACDRATSITNVMLLNRTIYSTVIARMYHTVALRTVEKTEKFQAALNSSSHLSPIIHNLWISHEVTHISTQKRYSITSKLLNILTLVPNLRRLAIMSPLYYNNTHLNPILLPKLVQLVIPSVWLVGLPGSNTSIFSHFPPDLTALHIRGRVGVEEANQLVTHCLQLRYATVRVFASVSLTDLVKFTQVLVSGLKELLSLELMLASKQDANLREAELARLGAIDEEKVSVRVVVDNNSEMDIWMNESRSIKPTWAH